MIVFPHDPLYRLLGLLDIKDTSIYINYKSKVYPISSNQTFEEIGLIKDDNNFCLVIIGFL